MNSRPDKAPEGKGAAPKRRRPPPDAYMVIGEQIRHLLDYVDECDTEATIYDAETRESNQRLGSQPRPTIPKRLWATVQDHDDAKDGKIQRYKERLLYLKSRGLYDGPTELTYEGKDDE